MASTVGRQVRWNVSLDYGEPMSFAMAIIRHLEFLALTVNGCQSVLT
jgi:hypothetical protein